MGWETRRRGGSYYTRSRKVNGRVVREYVGSGVLGEIAALEDSCTRLRREEEAAFSRAERERIEALAAPVIELCKVAQLLTRAHLVAWGYRKSQGKWRRAREK
jgi:hypothetical protein